MEPKFIKKLGPLIHEWVSFDNKPALVTFHEAIDITKEIINSKKYKGIKRFGEKPDSLNNGGYGVVFSNKGTREKFYNELLERLKQLL